MLKQLIVLCAIASTVLCRNTASNYNSLHSDQLSDKDIGNNEKNDESFLNWMDISSIYHKYKNYTNSDISVFLKLKLLSSLNSVAKGDIDFGNGVRFVRDHSAEQTRFDDAEAEFSENTILKSMPRTIGASEDYLSSKIWKRIAKLMRSHTVQVSRELKRFCNQLIKFCRYLMNYVVPHFMLDSLYLIEVPKKHKTKSNHKNIKRKKHKYSAQQQPQEVQQQIQYIGQQEQHLVPSSSYVLIPASNGGGHHA